MRVKLTHPITEAPDALQRAARVLITCVEALIEERPNLAQPLRPLHARSWARLPGYGTSFYQWTEMRARTGSRPLRPWVRSMRARGQEGKHVSRIGKQLVTYRQGASATPEESKRAHDAIVAYVAGMMDREPK